MQEIERMITPRQAAEAEGRGITTIYKRLARDEYDAVKDGKSTLILWPLSTEDFFQPLQRGDLGVKMLTRLSACWAEGNLSRFGPCDRPRERRKAARKREGPSDWRRTAPLENPSDEHPEERFSANQNRFSRSRPHFRAALRLAWRAKCPELLSTLILRQ
jgi:hypothetical protein